MRFRALKWFHSNETGSDYLAGFTYTVRYGNDLLASLVNDWAAQGLIEFVEEQTNAAAAAGRGNVN